MRLHPVVGWCGNEEPSNGLSNTQDLRLTADTDCSNYANYEYSSLIDWYSSSPLIGPLNRDKFTCGPSQDKD